MISEFTIDNRKYYAGFTQGVVTLKDRVRLVTTCVLRTTHPMITVYGNTIMNEKDSPNPDAGNKWAYKRAVEQMSKYAALLSARDTLKNNKKELVKTQGDTDELIKCIQAVTNVLDDQLSDAGLNKFMHACHLAWHYAKHHTDCCDKTGIVIDTSNILVCEYCLVDSTIKQVRAAQQVISA